MYGKTNAGGGGNSFATSDDAVLKVLTPAAATVTVTKGGASKTGSSWYSSETTDNKVHLFTIKQSQFDSSTPWVVSSTVSNDTKSANVTIDAARVYETSLLYRLPLAYQEVAYIESTGTDCYINTYIPASSVASIYIKGRITAAKQYAPLFGANESSSSIEGSKVLAYVPYGTNSLGYYYVNGNGYMSDANMRIAANTDFEVTFTVSNTEISATVNGSTKSVSGSVGSRTSKPIWIFTNNYNGNYISGGIIKARIKEVKIWGSNNILLAHYIPCYRKSDNKPGFYDLADSPAGNVVFKTKSGSNSAEFTLP